MAKHVMTNNEVAHAWFHQYEELGHGRNGTGSFYFEGPTIYSYGRHFPVATIVELPEPLTNGKRRIVLRNTDNYSITTSQHKSDAWSAVDRNVAHTLHVYDLRSDRIVSAKSQMIYAALEDVDKIMLAAQENGDDSSNSAAGVAHKRAQEAAEAAEVLSDLLRIFPDTDIRPKTREKIAKLLKNFDLEEYSAYLCSRIRQYRERNAAVAAAEREQYLSKVGNVKEQHMRFWNTFRDMFLTTDEPDDIIDEVKAGIMALPSIPQPPKKAAAIVPATMSLDGGDLLRNMAVLMTGSLVAEFENGATPAFGDNLFYLMYSYLLDGKKPSVAGATEPELEADIRRAIAPLTKAISKSFVDRYIIDGAIRTDEIDYPALRVLGLDNILGGFSERAHAMLTLGTKMGEERIVTSLGVSISIDEFKRYCRFLDAVEKHGLPAIPERMRKVSKMYNIHGFDNETITIGCHVIPWYNVRELAKVICTD